LVGVAETDETYFLQSFKGLHNGLTRPARKWRTSNEQIPVLVTRDRAGSTADAIRPADDKASVVDRTRGAGLNPASLLASADRTLRHPHLTRTEPFLGVHWETNKQKYPRHAHELILQSPSHESVIHERSRDSLP
jgi:hypothetical protein